jgi:uncharacterized protein DUF4430
VIRRALSALVVLVLVAGCGGAAGDEEGTAQLWITRDRGVQLLVDAEVQAGQTLMRALASEADVDTRYGGRYVQSVNGIEGSLTAQRDWFWFVNGYEGDRSAASYRLHDGDVAWLDYRAWRREGEARVVVGAFPEPFLHGYAGRTRPFAIRYDRDSEKRARKLGADLGAAKIAPLGTPVPAGANVLEVRGGATSLTAELLGETAGDPVRFVWRGDPTPERRYTVP